MNDICRNCCETHWKLIARSEKYEHYMCMSCGMDAVKERLFLPKPVNQDVENETRHEAKC